VWRPGRWRLRRRCGGQGGGVRGTDVEIEAVEAGAAAGAVVDSRWVPARSGRWTTGPGGAPQLAGGAPHGRGQACSAHRRRGRQLVERILVGGGGGRAA
jgi:hypothetical protein